MACVLLNKTNATQVCVPRQQLLPAAPTSLQAPPPPRLTVPPFTWQVRRVIWDLFALCPTPAAAVAADQQRLCALLRPLGLHRKRAAGLQQARAPLPALRACALAWGLVGCAEGGCCRARGSEE